jgi:hypothetical protein
MHGIRESVHNARDPRKVERPAASMTCAEKSSRDRRPYSENEHLKN